MKVYGLKHKDLDIRQHSTSGGAFAALAEDVLKHKGVVYGAGFDENYHVKHMRITSVEDLKIIRGVKYVQSAMGDCFKRCKEDLLCNLQVMFVGTPCQIFGLKHFLGELSQSNNLLLCVLICHGTPNPKVWNDYVKYFVGKYGQVSFIEFRDKTTRKWRDCKGTALVNGERISIDEYAKLFYLHDIVNKACFNCKFANLNREGDLTLGDFWGIENKHPEYDDQIGVSLVLCNTQRGQNALKSICDNVDLFESSLDGCRQPQLYKPTKKPFTYDYFWRVYQTKGFDGILQMTRNPLSMYTILRKSERLLKGVVKKILGRG